MSTLPIVEMPSAAPTPAPNFDRLAYFYRWMEFFTFGPFLHRCRCAFLGDLTSHRRALILGDGDGRFTAELVRANPTVQIDAVDASPAMLDALRRRAGPHAARIHAHCADARSWQHAAPPYDLVVTHFFLDCLTIEEIRSIAGDIRTAISPSTVWIVSEFAIPTGWFGRLLCKPLILLLYRAFGLLTGLTVRNLPDHCTAMREAGFALGRKQPWLNGLLVSETWKMDASAGKANVTTLLKSGLQGDFGTPSQL